MVHSQVAARRPAPHPHWDELLRHAGEKDWLTSWLATILREPERRVPGLLVTGPQASGKTALCQAISSLFPNDCHVTDQWTKHMGSMLKGERILNIFESPETHVLQHMARHERLVANVLSIQGSKSHWVELCQGGHHPIGEEDGIWLKRICLEPVERPMPDLSKHLENERRDFLLTLKIESLCRYMSGRVVVWAKDSRWSPVCNGRANSQSVSLEAGGQPSNK